MNWKKIVCIFLIATACQREETTVILENNEKDIRIDKSELIWAKSAIRDFYQKHDFKTVWRDSVNRSELISAILDSRYDGVLPEKYPVRALIKAHHNYGLLTQHQLKTTDIDFTENYFRIAQQLATGKVNPKKLYGDWEPYIPEINYADLLAASIQKSGVYEGLENIKPKHELYLAYKEKFSKYVPIILKDTTTTVGYLQKKIWVNLERSKWLQPDLGKQYVWINLPEYQLKVVSDGRIVEKHKVIIGKTERRTPVLSSSFSGIIINPKWTVPPTILKNDVVPKASSNRGYFESNRLTIFDKKSGKAVSPENWNPDNYNGYRYVQQTGKLNSLGLIKFDFPNKHMVYLHDTNNRSKFVESNRALSSGCVRVQNPFKLAETLFQYEGIDMSRSEIDTLVVKEKTKNIKLNKKVNVHQVYFTAIIDSTNNVKLLPDVYNLDNMLYKRLTQ